MYKNKKNQSRREPQKEMSYKHLSGEQKYNSWYRYSRCDMEYTQNEVV